MSLESNNAAKKEATSKETVKPDEKVSNTVTPKQVVKPLVVSKPVDDTAYTVKDGDTLLSIANKHRISLGLLRDLNDLKKNSILRVGTKIKLK